MGLSFVERIVFARANHGENYKFVVIPFGRKGGGSAQTGGGGTEHAVESKRQQKIDIKLHKNSQKKES